MTANYIKSTRETRGESPRSGLLLELPYEPVFFFTDKLTAIKCLKRIIFAFLCPINRSDSWIRSSHSWSVLSWPNICAPFFQEFLLHVEGESRRSGPPWPIFFRVLNTSGSAWNLNHNFMIPVLRCGYYNMKGVFFSWQIQCGKCIWLHQICSSCEILWEKQRLS